MIREATPKDIPYILDLYRKGLEELGETNISESCMLRKIVNSYQLAPCFLLEIDDIIAGIAGLTVITSSHNGDATLSEYMFYVLPEHRSLKNLSGLVEKSKAFASQNDFPLRLQFFTDQDQKVRERLFEMHDFKVIAVVGVYNERR